MAEMGNKRPVDVAEDALIKGILDGTYPMWTKLPGERRLVELIGVTRPTLREALRRLEQDGWLTVQHGKATVVNNYWQDGGMNIITTLTRFPDHMPHDFVSNLLQVRTDLAPSYMSLAVQNNQKMVLDYLAQAADPPATAEALARYDWGLHHMMTIASGNPIYTLVMNGFAGFYEQMAVLYFSLPETEGGSRPFYTKLYQLAQTQAIEEIRVYVAEEMAQSAERWKQVKLL